MSNDELFQCPICGLHYRNAETAKQCEEFCRANEACSMEIAKMAVEYQQREGETVDES